MGMDDHWLDKTIDDMDYVRKILAEISTPETAPDGPMKKKKVSRKDPCQGCVDTWNRMCDTYNRAYAKMILVDPIFEPCPLGDKCANEVRRKEEG